MKLMDRVSIVTGAGRGIGRAIAEEFLKEGAVVAMVDKNDALLRQAARELSLEHADKVVAINANVTKSNEVEKMVGEVAKRFKGIDILVNNAGIVAKGWVVDFREQVWDEVMEANLKSAFIVSRAVLPSMIKNKYGRIISISSIAGKQGEAAGSIYAASKFGLIGFTQALALEVAKDNVLVNAICPGLIPTDMGEYGVEQDAMLRGITAEQHRQSFIDRTPLGRLGTPTHVARMCVFLASSDCDFTTGDAFNVSGGYIMH